MSEELTREELKELIGLLAGLAAEGVVARRHELFAGLARLIHAQCWCWILGSGAQPDREPAIFANQSDGWSSPGQMALVIGAYHAPAGMLLHTFFRKRFGQHASCIRADLASDAAWFASNLYRHHLQLVGLADLVVSAYPLEQGVISGVTFFRPPHAGPFTTRHRAMVHMIMHEAKWLHQGPTHLPVTSEIPLLSLRCREVLVHLLNGDSRKQIARKLHRSENTIADSVKTLYRELRVSSRGELMARFLSGSPVVASADQPVALPQLQQPKKRKP